MDIDLRHMNAELLDDAARHYSESGFLLLNGVEDIITAGFQPVLADKLGVDVELFHRVICCDRDAFFNGNLHRLDNDPSPR